MGNKVPWKTGMLIYLPVTSQPLISLQKEAVLSPCNFATTHSTACILDFYLPLTSRPMKRRTLSQRPTLAHLQGDSPELEKATGGANTCSMPIVSVTLFKHGAAQVLATH